MALPVQPYLFTQPNTDSGALTMLATVVHRFREPGDYRAAIKQPASDVPVGVFYLTVDPNEPSAQVNIDLADAGNAPPAGTVCACGKTHSAAKHYVVAPESYVVFHVGGGPGGYSAHLSRTGDGPQPKIFDTTELGPGDLFAATLLRPGLYSLTNALAQETHGAEITVTYPPTSQQPFTTPPAARVKTSEKGFRPARLRLIATQGIVIETTVPSRYLIELQQPLDPPNPKRRASN